MLCKHREFVERYISHMCDYGNDGDSNGFVIAVPKTRDCDICVYNIDITEGEILQALRSHRQTRGVRAIIRTALYSHIRKSYEINDNYNIFLFTRHQENDRREICRLCKSLWNDEWHTKLL